MDINNQREKAAEGFRQTGCWAGERRQEGVAPVASGRTDSGACGDQGDGEIATGRGAGALR